MKITIPDQMPDKRADAETQVNDHFDGLARGSMHRDQEHQRKRAVAEAYPVSPVPQWFADAAAVEGMSVDAFVAEILSKPDELAERGVARRRAIVAVRVAAKPADIDAALSSAGIKV